MTLSDLSIRRPVLATVCSLLVITFGFFALSSIPVRELPDVDAAIVTVTTYYRGASPQVIDTDITEVIESSLGGIAGVKTIASQSRRGRSRTVVEFQTGRKIDEAANDVRDAVGRARSALPEDSETPIVVKSDSDSDPVMRIAVLSNRHNPEEITDYVERFIVDQLSIINGVASVKIRGERRYAMRIWLNRHALAARNITITDVENGIRRSNIELPAGDLISSQRMLEIRLDARLSTPEEFSKILVGKTDGAVVLLGDVAQVIRGVENESLLVRANGKPAVGISILRQGQSNTMDISDRVRAKVKRLTKRLPDGMEIIVGSDDALFISASIREVLIALCISLGLVVFVIAAFLRSFRATIVPLVTIPISLIGCMGFIWLFGFSINVLTLLALLLAIGLVVDDAIVVLENIRRRMDEGEETIVATARGTRQVTFAVLSTSLTLISVFIPISFLEGQVGRLFSEFGLVLASAVVISTFVSLSLCPVIASRVLKPRINSGKPRIAFRDSRIGQFYRKLVKKALYMPLVTIAVAGVFAGLAVAQYLDLPRELAPREDRGVAFIPITAPQGSTIAYTDSQAAIIEKQLHPFQENGDIETLYSIVGWGNRPYRGFIVMRLAAWNERDKSQAEIVRDIRHIARELPGARAGVASPAGLGLRGNSSPLRVVVGGADFDDVREWADVLLEHAEQNPQLINPTLDYEENQAQLGLTLDRRRADDLQISAQEIASTLQVLFASKELTTYVDRGREYPVIIQAPKKDRRTIDDLNNVYIGLKHGTNAGKVFVPINSLVSVSESTTPSELRRYNRLPSITLKAGLAPEYPLGDAVAYIEKGADSILPIDAKLGYAGQSAIFKKTADGMLGIFVLAIVVVFLVLAAQFESFLQPFVIILSVPLAIAGAIYSLAIVGLSLNVYTQIGIILLIGLMAKNGILIVEFANQLRERGFSVRESVLEASVLRLRPILMTVISTVLGAIPLIAANGAGAESRIAIGWVIVGGLGSALVLTLFVTPVLYDYFARFTKPRGAIQEALALKLTDDI